MKKYYRKLDCRPPQPHECSPTDIVETTKDGEHALVIPYVCVAISTLVIKRNSTASFGREGVSPSLRSQPGMAINKDTELPRNTSESKLIFPGFLYRFLSHFLGKREGKSWHQYCKQAKTEKFHLKEGEIMKSWTNSI